MIQVDGIFVQQGGSGNDGGTFSPITLILDSSFEDDGTYQICMISKEPVLGAPIGTPISLSELFSSESSYEVMLKDLSAFLVFTDGGMGESSSAYELTMTCSNSNTIAVGYGYGFVIVNTDGNIGLPGEITIGMVR